MLMFYKWRYERLGDQKKYSPCKALKSLFQVKFVLVRVLSTKTSKAKGGNMDVEERIVTMRRLTSLCNDILEVLNVLDPGVSSNRGRVLKEIIPPIMNISNYELENGIIDQSEWKSRKTYCSKLAKDLVECYKFEFI